MNGAPVGFWDWISGPARGQAAQQALQEHLCALWILPCVGVLLWHEGHRVNPERVYRLYQAAGLGERVTRVLTAVAEQRGWPAAVRGDHGPAFTSRGFLAWCAAHHITVQHIQRGQPMQDAWIECFNGRLREGYGTSMPNGFRPLFDTRHTIAAWR